MEELGLCFEIYQQFQTQFKQKERKNKISESNVENTHKNSNEIRKHVQFENSSNQKRKKRSQALGSSFYCVKENNKLAKFLDFV